MTYSCIEGEEVWPGAGNINQDPLFVGGGDYRLEAGSPCIDGGILEDNMVETDIDGKPRLCGQRVDMGAHESGDCAPSTFRRGDCNADGTVDVTDPVANLGFQFVGTFDPPCLDALDFNDSGELDITDPIASLTYQFVGGPPPAAPGKEICGADPTVDDLGCENLAACEVDG